MEYITSYNYQGTDVHIAYMHPMEVLIITLTYHLELWDLFKCEHAYFMVVRNRKVFMFKIAAGEALGYPNYTSTTDQSFTGI